MSRQIDPKKIDFSGNKERSEDFIDIERFLEEPVEDIISWDGN